MIHEPATEAETGVRQAHAAAVQALADSRSTGLQETLRDLRAVLLSTDSRALKRSVGFWGRLIGRDIRLHADVQALQKNSGVLLHRADVEVAKLREQHQILNACVRDLRAANADLKAELDTLARTLDADDEDGLATRRFARLSMLHNTCAITIAQVDIVAGNALQIADRHAQQLPHLALLLKQYQAVQAGSERAARLSSMQRTLDELEACLDSPISPATAATASSMKPIQENP